MLHLLALFLTSSNGFVIPRGTSSDIKAASELRSRNAAAGFPLPSQAQLQGALQHQFTVFMHYSMCTYTGCQWNLATSPAQDFAPPDSGPNATQWAETAKKMGATQICLTVRHVGGFALWQTASTNYSVANSTWRDGKGDVVAEFTSALRAVGISPCLYIIVGFNVEDAHNKVPGPEYLDRQVTALTELLTNYGQIDRLWWDNYAIGCCQPVTHEGFYCPGGSTTSTPGPGCAGWQVVIDLVRYLSPSTAIVPGPDGCLVNGESFGGTYPLYHATSLEQNSYSCTNADSPGAGPYFAVVESDFTILEPGDNWFWKENSPYLNASQTLQQVNAKLEQGANLILNVPPNASGVVEEEYLAQLTSFGDSRAETFSDPRASLPAPISALCEELSITLPVTGDFDTVLLTEDLVAGQVLAGYTLEALKGGAWMSLPFVHGATVGLRLLDSVGLQQGVTALRFNCSATLPPSVAPPNSPPPVQFKNTGGTCAGMAQGASFPCWKGGEGPFSLCPLVATACDTPASALTPGAFGPNTYGALALAPDATLNVDCNSCTLGTHVKIIKNGRCDCSSTLSYNASLGTLEVVACPGMCLSNGLLPGANASCAGTEPWTPTQVHLIPCNSPAAVQAWELVAAPAPPPVATLSFLGAFLRREPKGGVSTAAASVNTR